MIGPMKIHQIDSKKGDSCLPFIDLAESDGEQSILDFSNVIDEHLSIRGALLIRGMTIRGSKKLSSVLSGLFGAELINYDYASTPRTKLRGNVYTSTEFPPSEKIPLHNENSYSNKWPLRIAFFCTTPSEIGGETPIADSRAIYNALPENIREEFEERGLRYTRNYSDIDVPWPQVFGTRNKEEVERYCALNHIDFKWLENDQLQTAQTNLASRLHPDTQERIWFNQAHLFHTSRLSESDERDMIRVFGADRLPRNVYFGDGEPIPEDSLNLIRKTLDENQIVFRWQKNDLLLLDNMLFCHGRNSYQGDRKVLVGMTRPFGDTPPE